MTPDPQWTPEYIAEVLGYSEKATYGPWKFTQIPKIPTELGIKSMSPNEVIPTEDWLVTDWVHPQLKAELPIVTIAIGPYYEPRHAIHIRREDGEFLAKARTDLPSAVREIQRLTPFMEAFRDSGLPEDWELEHPAMKYVTIQVDKSDWLKMRALLDAKEAA